MKALPNRLVVDVKFRRWTLVSQWPVMLHDWVDRDGWCDEPAKDLQMGLRLLIVLVLNLSAMFVLVVGSVIATDRFFGPGAALLAPMLSGAICQSFFSSYHSGKPWGLFWLIERLEQPLRLKSAPKSG